MRRSPSREGSVAYSTQAARVVGFKYDSGAGVGFERDGVARQVNQHALIVPVQGAGWLVLGDSRLKEVLFFVQVHRGSHPRERVSRLILAP